MAISLMGLPAIRLDPNGIDFSPVQNALAGYRQGADQAYEAKTKRDIGNALAGPGGIEEARKIAAQFGDLETNLGLAKFGMAQRQEQREEKKFQSEEEQRVALKMAKAYQMILDEKDPAKQQAMHDKIMSIPTYAQAVKGLDWPEAFYKDPVVMGKWALAQAAPFRDQLQTRAITAQAAENEASAELKIAQAKAAANKGVGYSDLKQYADASEGLRKEFNNAPQVKNYIDAQSAADRLGALVKQAKGGQFGSGAGDIAMVFSFIKALDPTSVVQPGEQATARNAPGVSDQLLNTYNRLLTGQFLTPQTRDDFMKVIESELRYRKDPAVEMGRRYRTIARQLQMDPSHIVPKVFGGVDLDGDGIPDAGGAKDPAAPPFTAPPRELPKPGQRTQAPREAVQLLLARPTPEIIRQFEEKYGPGSAREHLERQ